ncbi:MAG TPA: methyltransferase domain-containing protein [Verrucomicrobiae bacterium]|nr:methyltransferase domain-containing protein [Verrucomicrobiae bacterium]
MPLEAVTSLVTFGSELLSNPRPMGSAVPSSRFLGRRMASFLPRNPRGYVVELGAGTGSITAALLGRGIPADRLIPVERSETMFRHLRKRFPHVKIALGDATELRALLTAFLGEDDFEVSYIVSSLPLRSLPEAVVTSILHEVSDVLHKDGKLVQFTYNLGKTPNPALSGFKRRHTTVVWANFPPARVDVFQKNAKHA